MNNLNYANKILIKDRDDMRIELENNKRYLKGINNEGKEKSGQVKILQELTIKIIERDKDYSHLHAKYTTIESENKRLLNEKTLLNTTITSLENKRSMLQRLLEEILNRLCRHSITRTVGEFISSLDHAASIDDKYADVLKAIADCTIEISRQHKTGSSNQYNRHREEIANLKQQIKHQTAIGLIEGKRLIDMQIQMRQNHRQLVVRDESGDEIDIKDIIDTAHN
jgi:hypothetical protein